MDAHKTKVMIKMLVILAIVFGAIFAYKMIGGLIFSKYAAAHKNPTISVSTTKATYQMWQPQLKAVGTMRAVRGVNVTAELAGMVRTIYFKPGSDVKEGDLLVELNIDPDVALLHSLEAQSELNTINFRRDSAQYAINAVSKAVVDTDAANLKSGEAQVAEQAALVNKKIIRAPFTGRLGVSAVNPGQYITPGNTMVNLQALTPIYVDFYVPQQEVAKLVTGLDVTVTSDSYPKQVFTGKITTIEPMVDLGTRNIKVEATLNNPHYYLLPGMFVNVTLNSGPAARYITLPQTAINFNTYGEIAYIVNPVDKNKSNASTLTVAQKLVTVGESRGDQIVVLSGIKEGDVVVTAGQLKLKNGSPVKINNQILPNNNPSPQVSNETN
jgi:membrane fusion protein (multidrug efflux system)